MSRMAWAMRGLSSLHIVGRFLPGEMTTVPGHRRTARLADRDTDKQLESTLVQISQKPSPMHLASLILALSSRVPKRLTPMAFRIVLHPAASSNLLVVGIQIHDRILSQLPASKLFQLFVQHPGHSRDLARDLQPTQLLRDLGDFLVRSHTAMASFRAFSERLSSEIKPQPTHLWNLQVQLSHESESACL